MIFFIIYAACAGILLFNFRPLAAQMGTKEKVLCLALLTIGLAALTLNELGVELPSITRAFQEAFISIFGEL